MSKAFFEALSGLDAWFLYAERHEAPLHIGATYIFEGTPQVKGGRGAQGLAHTIEERLHLVPRYRQKVMRLPGNLGNPVWVDDPDFDLSYHVRRAALPSPGDEATLRDYTARVFARPLDLNKPLWEMTVVEGLSGDRVAVVNKVHHAMVDGILHRRPRDVAARPRTDADQIRPSQTLAPAPAAKHRRGDSSFGGLHLARRRAQAARPRTTPRSSRSHYAFAMVRRLAAGARVAAAGHTAVLQPPHRSAPPCAIGAGAAAAPQRRQDRIRGHRE